MGEDIFQRAGQKVTIGYVFQTASCAMIVQEVEDRKSEEQIKKIKDKEKQERETERIERERERSRERERDIYIYTYI